MERISKRLRQPKSAYTAKLSAPCVARTFLAIEQLELLEARFPFGRFAEQAQLELIYAHYLIQDMDSARANADRFIRLHPAHPNVDYAYYLRALSAYKFKDGLLDRLFSANPASRDMAPLRESYSELALLLNEFPDSQYASDARQRMLQLRELLARSEIFAADYYLRRGAYVAAANRGAYVIDNYPDTVARADALARMVEATTSLGAPRRRTVRCAFWPSTTRNIQILMPTAISFWRSAFATETAPGPTL